MCTVERSSKSFKSLRGDSTEWAKLSLADINYVVWQYRFWNQTAWGLNCISVTCYLCNLGWAASPLDVSVSSSVKWVLTVVLSTSWGCGEDYRKIIHINHLGLILGYFAPHPCTPAPPRRNQSADYQYFMAKLASLIWFSLNSLKQFFLLKYIFICLLLLSTFLIILSIKTVHCFYSHITYFSFYFDILADDCRLILYLCYIHFS